MQRVPFATMDEWQGLWLKFGNFVVDNMFVGPPDPPRAPRSEPILRNDCIPIPGTKPLICPRSSPKLPVERLPQVEARFRSLLLVKSDQTVLWIGRQARMETVCMYCDGCDCFKQQTDLAVPPQYVTLDQMAAVVPRSKRTLEKLIGRESNPLPDPDIQGGGGKPNEWDWHRIRPWLEQEYGRELPVDYPNLRG